MAKGVAGAGSCRFPNGTLGSDNYGHTVFAELWLLVFGEIYGARTSVGDSVTLADSMGGVKVVIRG